MDHHSQHVLTLANSIIGVSILAMPYCFKQCGILLAVIILLLTSLISRLSSHFLIKSAIIARRKTFEYLAYYIFGGLGKFAIEVGIIGFLIGTCIAFFVVMGDLGPEIISEISGQDTSSTMRTSILMALALFCVLPLGLLRNIDSLSGVSRATIGFYICLILKIVIEALPHIFSGDWFNKVEIWRPGGIIQCLPIFSMALSCQTQLFEIYQVVHNPTLDKMNHIVKNAVNICTLVYLLVGFFGYIAFAQKNFTGNILLSFSPSVLTNAIKLGFILSIAFSFPLVIFPCRASIHSLIYREGFSLHEGVSNYIPEGRFKALTFIIVFVSLIVGILIPNIELVLGLVGSTIGIMICVLFPVICFIYISQKNTNERLLAKLVLIVGFILMILGTYENLHSLEKIELSPVVENLVTENRELKIIDPAAKDLAKDVKIQSDELVVPDFKTIKKDNNQTKIQTIVKVTDSPEIRHEPPQPFEPQDSQPVKEILDIKVKSEEDKLDIKVKSEEEKLDIKMKSGEDNKDVKVIKNINKNLEENHIQEKNIRLLQQEEQLLEKQKVDIPEKHNEQAAKPQLDGVQNNFNETKNDQVDIEAIRKDDKETQLQQKEEKKEDSHLEEHKILLDTIQKQNEVQEEIVKQQKKLIEVIEKQQDQKAKEEKLKAVKEIETIALQAIEKISSDAKNNEKIVAELEKNVNQKVNTNEEVEVKNNEIEKQQDVVLNAKLKDLKVVNRLLDSKIKQNNITTRRTLIDKEDNKNEDISITNKNNKGLVQNSTHNAKLGTKFNNSKQDDVPLYKSNTFNNTAPLFLNLGSKTKSNNNSEVIKKVVPLPIVVLNSKQSNNVSNNVNKSINKFNDNEILVNKNIDKNNNELLNEEAKVMRRDILAYMLDKRR